MKILLAHKYFKYNGGADVFFFEVGRVLRANGHEVAYFSTQDNENIESVYSKYFVKAPDFSSGNIVKRMVSFTGIPYNWNSKKQFEKLLLDFKPDIVHVFNIITQISPSILDVARKRNIPVVMSCNDYKHICPNYKLLHHNKICEDCKGGRFYCCIKNKCCHESLLFSIASSVESYIHKWLNIYKKNVNLFLFSSDFMASKTKEFWNDNSIHYGKLVNPFKIPETNIKSESGNYGLYFGRLIEEKGVDKIIYALRNLTDIPFKIIGDGPEIESLKKLRDQFQLTNIEFIGSLWGEDLNTILYKSKFVVVPSTWNENFPYVILQAFAACKPVLGSNRGGIPELVINNETGFVFDVDNTADLSEKIDYLYHNDDLCVSMGQNANKFVIEHFNDTLFYNELIKQYQKIL